MKCNQLLAVAVAAAFAAGGTSGVLAAEDKQQSRSGQNGSASAGATVSPDAPIIVLVPVQLASSDTLGNGCWARLYDSANFRGNQLSLVGPVDMPNMRTAFGTDWGGEFDSIQVGPKATLTVYDNENYRDKAATLKPGQKVADLDTKLGTFEDIRSVKIACAGGTPTAQSGQNGSASAGGGSAGSTFERLDTNNDGSLSRSEYQKYKR